MMDPHDSMAVAAYVAVAAAVVIIVLIVGVVMWAF